jgi:hypothetical protein
MTPRHTPKKPAKKAARRRIKTAAKTPDVVTDSAPALVEQPHGGALLSGGVPGNKGGTGRPPDEFKARMRELVTRAEVEQELETVLGTRDHPQWLGALKYATEHGYGKPKESLEVSGKIGLETLLVESMGGE